MIRDRAVRPFQRKIYSLISFGMVRGVPRIGSVLKKVSLVLAVCYNQLGAFCNILL